MTPPFLGLGGPALTDAERAFFRSVNPAGYILFRRNVADPAQLRALTADLRSLSGRDDLPIRSEEHTSELQSLMRISYAVFCLKKKKKTPLMYEHRYESSIHET